MTVDAVRRAYDALAEDYAALLPDTRAESLLDLPPVDAFARAASRRVLDAACGTGRLSRYLADQGCQVEGVGLSPGMVAQAAAGPSRPSVHDRLAHRAALARAAD